MPQDQFLIAPLDKGRQENVEPFLIMDDAFQLLRNVYNWRGRIKKRFGSRVMNGGVSDIQKALFTRLRINLGQTDGNGDLAGAVPGVIRKVGQMFSCGDEIFTVNTAGAVQNMLKTGGATTYTYDTTNGNYDIKGSTATTILYFYPAEPVMSFDTYNRVAINDEELFAFDTQFAYRFTFSGGWFRENTEAAAGDSLWTNSANKDDFFWTTNFRGLGSEEYLMFITNNRASDTFRYWNGTQFASLGTAGTTPTVVGGANFIKTCRIIEPFKDRLLLFSTTERIGAGDITYRNRVRFSKNGSPISLDSWLETPGLGGFLDAPVKESIISVSFLKDRLIVDFERSTWELAYTNNEALPFRWQRLNDELGVESSNSTVQFDRAVLGFGQSGIHACNGMNVDRIDDLIPDTIYDVSNGNQGPKRVAGIRDFYPELVYWSYQSTEADTGTNSIYPNRVLVYDYENGTWSYNDDSITAFGNFQLEGDVVWQNIAATWQEMGQIWNDPSLQELFKTVIGGNQQGYTFICDTKNKTNSIAIQITDIAVVVNVVKITAIDHNLPLESYIRISQVQADGGTMVATLNGKTFKATALDDDTIEINTGDVTIAGNYTGGGNVARVSEIEIITKQYNFYNKLGLNIAFNQVNFYVDKTSTETIDGNEVGGQITVDYMVSSATNISIVDDARTVGALIGTSILETTPYTLVPLESEQDRFWHSMFLYAHGENIQLRLYMTNDQMTTQIIADSAFQLNGLMFYTSRTEQFG